MHVLLPKLKLSDLRSSQPQLTPKLNTIIPREARTLTLAFKMVRDLDAPLVRSSRETLPGGRELSRETKLLPRRELPPPRLEH